MAAHQSVVLRLLGIRCERRSLVGPQPGYGRLCHDLARLDHAHDLLSHLWRRLRGGKLIKGGGRQMRNGCAFGPVNFGHPHETLRRTFAHTEPIVDPAEELPVREVPDQ
ncbi:hypothetical protein GCM10023069_41100 [Shinella granuli]